VRWKIQKSHFAAATRQILRTSNFCFLFCSKRANKIPTIATMTTITVKTQIILWPFRCQYCPTTRRRRKHSRLQPQQHWSANSQVATYLILSERQFSRHLISHGEATSIKLIAATVFWAQQTGGWDDGGGHCLVRLEWRPAGWMVCLPLLIFPCTVKSRSSLLAPAHPGGPGKRDIKRLWWWMVTGKSYKTLTTTLIVEATRTMWVLPLSYQGSDDR